MVNMSGLPPIDTIRHLLERLRANDISWFRERYKSGDLAWLEDHLPAGEYAKLGADFEAGNLDRLRGLLPGIPGLRELPGIGTLLGGLGGLGGAVAGAAGIGAMRDRAATGTTRITTPVADNENRRKPIAWLIPVAILAALAAILGLTQCNKDDKKSTVDTTLAAAPGSEAVATDSPATSAETAATDAAAGGNVVETALGAGKFTTLGAAITAAGLGDTLAGPGPFTVFAPNDAAFASLPPGVLEALLKPENKDALAKILTYHVVAGKVLAADVKTGPVKSVEGDELNLKAENGAVMVNDATVLSADVAASNGVVHEIDKVLLPPGFDLASLGATTESTAAPATTTAEAVPTTAAAAAAAADKDIIDTAVGTGNFTTLAAALNAAGLVDTLKGTGPFTVFAPTDDAFKALPAGLVDALLKPENKAVLSKILTYHVVAGTVAAADLKTAKVKTVEGDDVDVKVDGTTVMVNDATVTTADVAASNGLIHVIDKVLLPPGVDPAALIVAAPDTTVVAATATSIASVGAPESLTVYFDSGKSAIKADEQTKITGAVEKLSALPAGSKVNIVGHADKNGDARANQVLSVRRATEVEKALKAGLGAKASNVTFTVGAVGDTQAETDPAKARKVTIEVVPGT